MIKKVYAIGETLLDIIFDGYQVKAAKPGGSMLNSAVSLGRTGTDVSLITEFGQDQTGKLILDFLEKNHVKTGNIHLYKNGKTPLAMAFLNEKGDATYDFYKPYPKERLKVKIPDFTGNDILLFGSYFGIDPRVREKLLEIVKAARDAGSMIVYDPNFRKPHAHELEKLRPFILENMQLSHIIRASHATDIYTAKQSSFFNKIATVGRYLGTAAVFIAATIIFASVAFGPSLIFLLAAGLVLSGMAAKLFNVGPDLLDLWSVNGVKDFISLVTIGTLAFLGLVGIIMLTPVAAPMGLQSLIGAGAALTLAVAVGAMLITGMAIGALIQTRASSLTSIFGNNKPDPEIRDQSRGLLTSFRYSVIPAVMAKVAPHRTPAAASDVDSKPDSPRP